MDTVHWYDWIRIATMVFAVVAAYRLAHLVKEDYETYSTRLAEWVWVIFAVLFTQFAGALEALLKGTEYRYSALLNMFIALAAVRASRRGGPLQNF